jgi:hypothetical protein
MYILVALKGLQLTGHIQGIKPIAILDNTFGGQRHVSISSKTMEDRPTGHKTLKKRSNGNTSVERLYSGGQRLAIRLLCQRRRRR